MTIPQRTTEQITTQANNLLMKCYESENRINCYGYTPQKSSSPDYLRAKRKALKIAKQYNDLPLYNELLNH
jgi:hypothetical protein